MIAFITVGEIVKHDPGFVKMKGKEQKVWNCNVSSLFEDDEGNLLWQPGTRLKIDYNETTPQAGRKPSKYINNARPAREDEANTYPDKEPYQGGGSYGGGASKNMKKDDYDPEVGKRQTAANCAMQFFANAGATIDDLDANFDTVANIVLKFVNGGAPKSDDGKSDGSSGAGAGSQTDEEFDF